MNRDKKINVLFVCMGNICRSPAAEGTFRHQVATRGLEDRFTIDSAGTHAYHTGEAPNVQATKAAAERGITLDHRARQFRSIDFANFDYIFPMDEENLTGVLQLAGSESHKKKVHLFRKFDPTVKPETPPGVPDPYYGGMDGFYAVQDILDRTSPNLLEWILREERG